MVETPITKTDMTVMTEEVIRLMEEDRKRRLKRVRRALGFKKGDGRYVRYKGPYVFPDGKGYYVYTIIDPALKDCHTIMRFSTYGMREPAVRQQQMNVWIL